MYHRFENEKTGAPMPARDQEPEAVPAPVKPCSGCGEFIKAFGKDPVCDACMEKGAKGAVVHPPPIPASYSNPLAGRACTERDQPR